MHSHTAWTHAWTHATQRNATHTHTHTQRWCLLGEQWWTNCTQNIYYPASPLNAYLLDTLSIFGCPGLLLMCTIVESTTLSPTTFQVSKHACTFELYGYTHVLQVLYQPGYVIMFLLPAGRLPVASLGDHTGRGKQYIPLGHGTFHAVG